MCCVTTKANNVITVTLAPTCSFHVPSRQQRGVYQGTVEPPAAGDAAQRSSGALLQKRHSAGPVPLEFGGIFARVPLGGACITSRKCFEKVNQLITITFPQVHPCCGGEDVSIEQKFSMTGMRTFQMKLPMFEGQTKGESHRIHSLFDD